jgi:hypothetical protein
MARHVLSGRKVEWLKPFRPFGCALFLLGVALCAWAASGTLLPQSAGYPRLVRLTNGPATFCMFAVNPVFFAV